jgi:hypothetical protein
MSTNVRIAEKLRKFLSGHIIKNPLYLALAVKAKISIRYSPRQQLLLEENHHLEVQHVAEQPSDVIRRPVLTEGRAAEIKVP